MDAAASAAGVPGADGPLARRIRFAVEADRLKAVLRRTRPVDGSRLENSAEHSWHVALLAVLPEDAAPADVDVARVLRMLLVHDLVEVDAGDIFCYDADANLDREAREQAAAARLFGILPEAQARELAALWAEFEAAGTPDARFAAALDRLQPLLQNWCGGGGSWREHAITRAQVLRRMDPIREGAPALWPVVLAVVDRSCEAGWIAPDPPRGQ